jgi:hypothetical protein
MMRQRAGTDRTNTHANGGRECIEDIHGWRKPLGEPLIAVLRLIEFVGFPLKYCKNSFRSIAAFNLLCEWVCGKIFSGFLLVLFQGFIEDWLKFWSGRSYYLDVG